MVGQHDSRCIAPRPLPRPRPARRAASGRPRCSPPGLRRSRWEPRWAARRPVRQTVARAGGRGRLRRRAAAQFVVARAAGQCGRSGEPQGSGGHGARSPGCDLDASAAEMTRAASDRVRLSCCLRRAILGSNQRPLRCERDSIDCPAGRPARHEELSVPGTPGQARNTCLVVPIVISIGPDARSRYGCTRCATSRRAGDQVHAPRTRWSAATNLRRTPPNSGRWTG